MKEFANKNFATGAVRKAAEALTEGGYDKVAAYGAVLVDQANPEGKWTGEFEIEQPLEAFSPEDQAILADWRIDASRVKPQEAPQVTELPDNQGTIVGGPTPQTTPQGVTFGEPTEDGVKPQAGPQEGQQPPQEPQQPQEGQAPAVAQDAGTYGTAEVEEWNGTKHTLPIPKGAGRKFLPVRNDVAFPATFTQTREIWDAFDAASKAAGRIIMLFEVKHDLQLKGYSENAISTQYARWCDFWGYDAETRKAVREAHNLKATRGPGREPSTEAERQLAELKAREKAAKKEAKRIERDEKARLARIDREIERAAKRRSEAEAKRVAQVQNSEQFAKDREAALAANEAVMQERIAGEIAKQKAAAERAEAEAKARQEEYAKREAAAQARLQALLRGEVPAEG